MVKAKAPEYSELFSRITVDQATLDTEYVEVGPSSTVNKDTREYIFGQPRSEVPVYWQLSDTMLSMKLRIVKIKDDGTETGLSKEDNIRPVRFLPDTMFSKLEVYANDGLISQDYKFRGRFVDISRRLSLDRRAYSNYLEKLECAGPPEMDLEDYDSDLHKRLCAPWLMDSNGHIPARTLMCPLSHNLGGLNILLPAFLVSLKFRLEKDDGIVLLEGLTTEDTLTPDEITKVSEAAVQAGKNDEDVVSINDLDEDLKAFYPRMERASRPEPLSSTATEEEVKTWKTTEGLRKARLRKRLLNAKANSDRRRYEIRIDSIRLHLKKHVLNSEIYDRHRASLAQNQVCKVAKTLYPLKLSLNIKMPFFLFQIIRGYFYKNVTSWTNIPQGITSYVTPGLTDPNNTPAKVFFVLCRPNRLHGRYHLSANKYEKPPTLEWVDLYCDHKLVQSLKSIHAANYKEDLGVYQFIGLWQTLEAYYQPTDLCLSTEDVLDQCFILGFDLRTSSDKTDHNALPLLKSGELRLHMRFSEPLSQSWFLLYMGYSPAMLSITKTGLVSTSYRS